MSISLHAPCPQVPLDVGGENNTFHISWELASVDEDDYGNTTLANSFGHDYDADFLVFHTQNPRYPMVVITRVGVSDYGNASHPIIGAETVTDLFVVNSTDAKDWEGVPALSGAARA